MEHTLKHLKPRRAGGFDNILPEHLKNSGPIFAKRLCQVFNQVYELGRIPCFKHGVVISAYKGKGRDLLLLKSYCSITLTSVFGKVFKIPLLNRMSQILEDAGIPQLTQSAHRGNVACSDSIFTGQEAISKFTNEEDCVYSCFYDFASAFDTVEPCDLLEQLSHAGFKGKFWRLITNWYKNLSSHVCLGNRLSRPFEESARAQYCLLFCSVW